MDTRAPYTTRENTSRPRLSVPSQWAALEGFNRVKMSASS